MDWLLSLCVIAAPVLAARAFFRSRALTATILALKASVEVLDQRLSRLEDPRASVSEAPPAQALLPEETVGESTPFPVQSASPLLPRPAWKDWEKLLVENWLVWLGGVALALGGAFLVKLSIDQGWLTPSVRVVLGVLLGFGLSAAAEWVARRDPPSEEDKAPFYIPAALAAAGATTIFASLYAAHQLYGLLPPPLAFALLALTAGTTVAISLRHGPFVAALGLVGAFAVPLLVESDQPQALPLFAYLTLVGAASLAILRHRDWN